MGLTITSSAMKIFTYAAKSSMGRAVRRCERYCMLERTPQHPLEEKLVLRSIVPTTVLALVAAQAAFAQDPSTSSGQGFPSRPVRLIVPFAAGGVTDTSARAVSDRLGARLGQPVVVENRPGASGNIGTEQVARSAPDGHTLVLGFDGTMVINPHVPSKPSTSVWPSGALLATCSVPMLPEAPGRFSTTTGWPRRAPSRSVTARALVSVTPPAAKGTTNRTGRDGKACPEPVEGSCAKAAWAATSARTVVSTIGRSTSFSSNGVSRGRSSIQ